MLLSFKDFSKRLKWPKTAVGQCCGRSAALADICRIGVSKCACFYDRVALTNGRWPSQCVSNCTANAQCIFQPSCASGELWLSAVTKSAAHNAGERGYFNADAGEILIEFVTLQSIIENKQLQYAVLCLWSKIKALLLIIRLSWRHLVRNISCIKLKMNWFHMVKLGKEHMYKFNSI